MDYHSVLAKILPINFLTIVPAVTGILIFTAIVLLIISFLISGSEIAFFSLSQKDINVLKTKHNPSFKRIVTLLESPKTLLTSLIITNILVSLGIILVFNILLNNWLIGYNFSFWPTILIKAIAISFLLILTTKVLPKLWAINNKIQFAAFSSLVVEIFNSLFFGISKRSIVFSQQIENKFAPKKSNADNATDLDNEIDLLPENKATLEEKQLLKGIRKFGDTPVKQIMRTRLDVHGIEQKTSFKKLISTVEEFHYSRLPVYNNNLDEIIGVLHTKDLIQFIDEAEDYNWQKHIRTSIFVHEKKLIKDLLQEFRTKRVHFAIVVDEFGGTSGIVTLEDIMEEIIGEIKDEFDDEESINKKIDDNTYIFEGKLMINDACKAMGLPVDTFDKLRGESDSVAGLILEIAGEFPQIDTKLESGNFVFIPLEINKNRIDKVKILIK
ncbi:MAG: gliding motility-associated protein GldE [Ferruginibacter sp.]|nr:gliding motility-associated protein GldE [Ferruginibacter sp.]